MDKRMLGEVLEGYRLRRERNAQLARERQREIEENYPDISQLTRARHEFIMMSVRSAFVGGAPEDAENRMAAFNRDIRRALVSHGFPEDYLEPVYDCPMCRDTGYIGEGAQTPCDCLLSARVSAARDASEASETFEAFDETRFPVDRLPGSDVTQREYTLLVRDKCLMFADDYGRTELINALLYGASGLGKTYLLHCIANRVRTNGVDATCVTAYQLLAALRRAYFAHDESAARPYFDARLLLIDDLGMEPLVEGVTVEQIYHLLSDRMARGLGTVVSTNLSLDKIKERYTERVTSRLRDARTCLSLPFLGKDIRLIKP